ncbi:LysE family transporter [Rathayibacter iranicus]|uniref:Threonine transporter RhtB n=3 Tax=Rathayibacter iranicus TaxID=59737 RepID=A0AAD1AGA9_9MICO|nr:threonine transporter RhtB [Rathayibacter iranicus]PPI46403.1 threonine transporter RhtB [Rathayibacter iranicus]PPI59926.1 threonine transporter RhtB [Rathayibacter iranicus]PPI71394.1 threonine transporter RhtB [Rathayibacter iranicus]PWJ65451.1 homoserine/homoserine lactone efflux protein [Rathayibacter iranicus NCPPB 2253 = VKM Ac-1602]
MWVTCFMASWIFSLSPGSGSVFSMTNGLNYGFRRGYFGAIGLVIGLWAVFLVVVVGLGAIIQASPLAFNVLKWAGVGYLFYLGLTQWFSKATPISVSRTEGSMASIGGLIGKGIALNAINPKGYIFMLAIIPQFLVSSAPMPPQYIAVALTFAFTDLVVMAVYTGLAAKVAGYLKTEKQIKFVNRLFGALFMVAALVLATFQQVGH